MHYAISEVNVLYQRALHLPCARENLDARSKAAAGLTHHTSSPSGVNATKITYTIIGSNDEHNLTFILRFNEGARRNFLLTGTAAGAVFDCEVSSLFTRRGDPGAYFNTIDSRFFLYFFTILGHVPHASELSYIRLKFHTSLFFVFLTIFFVSHTIGSRLGDLKEVTSDLMWPRTLMLFPGP